MSKLCPLFKETCWEDKCVMHQDEQCLVTAYLRAVEKEYRENRSCSTCDQEDEEAQTPEWLKNTTSEALAEQIVAFKENELKESDPDIDDLTSLFWETKDIEYFFQPPDVKIKIHNAEGMAKRILENLNNQLEEHKP